MTLYRTASLYYASLAILPLGILIVISMFIEMQEIPGLVSKTHLPIYLVVVGAWTLAMAAICFVGRVMSLRGRWVLFISSLALALLASYGVVWFWGLLYLLPSWHLLKVCKQKVLPNPAFNPDAPKRRAG